jgi:glycosyltransferase involved in cell wall biosynthesis
MLGTRGVPAAHGGFETAVDHMGRALVDRGWRVVVYCQDDEAGAVLRTDTWEGLERVHVPSRFSGAKGTAWFDLGSVRHAAREAARSAHPEVCLTFGYNTAMLTGLLRARGIPNLINMDGIEWKRACWSGPMRGFLRAQERAGCLLGDHLVADHPVIREHLARQVPSARLTTIAYGAPAVHQAPRTVLPELGLEPGGFVTMVARPVPENGVLELVRAFSRRRRDRRLVVLGGYHPEVPFQRQVLEAAGDEVLFLGAVYDPEVVRALRFHSAGYLHGHRVGGTNPSLVEALGCGNPVIAHDNPYNRWVAGDAALWFTDEDDIDTALTRLLCEPGLGAGLAAYARRRHAEEFTWERITDRYETMLRAHLPAGAHARRQRRVPAPPVGVPVEAPAQVPLGSG